MLLTTNQVVAAGDGLTLISVLGDRAGSGLARQCRCSSLCLHHTLTQVCVLKVTMKIMRGAMTG